MDIGKNIERARQRAGLSQRALASQLDRTQQSISNWEKNEHEPEIEVLVKIAELTGATLDELIRGAAPPPASSAAAHTAAKMVEALRLSEDQVIRALNAATTAPPPEPYRQGDPIPGLVVKPGKIPTQAEAAEILKKKRAK